MRIGDLDESTLNEFIPLTKKGRAIRRAEKAGAADLSDNVTRLTKELAAHLGAQGKRMKSATSDDVIQFLKTKNVDTSDIGASDPINPKRIEKIFTAKIQKKMSGQSIVAKDTNADPQQQPEAAPQVKFTAKQPVQFKSKAGKLINATVVGKSKDGDDSVVIINSGKQNFIIKRAKLLDPKTGKPFEPGKQTADVTDDEIPAKLQKQIDALSPSQKQQLAKSLS
jgi:hypothetical protein